MRFWKGLYDNESLSLAQGTEVPVPVPGKVQSTSVQKSRENPKYSSIAHAETFLLHAEQNSILMIKASLT